MFQKILLEEAKRNGKSINQIERELGYPRNALHNYKNGHLPSGIRLLELAHYFGVSPHYFLGVSDEPHELYPNSYFKKMNSKQKLEMWCLCQEWALSELKCKKE